MMTPPEPIAPSKESDSGGPVDVKRLTPPELESVMKDQFQEPKYRGLQLFQWMHARHASGWDEMTNLSKSLREKLGANAAAPKVRLDGVQSSSDGTRKLRFLTEGGEAMESVLIPDGDKLTQCISSQVGCALGCRFCATAKMGLKRHLSASEIVDQVYAAQAYIDSEAGVLDLRGAGAKASERITNLVYMGMGEPLHNYDEVVRSIRILSDDHGFNLSPRRMTVSTVGMVSGLERFGREDLRVNLAISLNASRDEERDDIMPVNRKWNIDALLDAIRAYPLERRKRVTFEYVLLSGVNDTLEDARRLAQLLRGFRCKVNIIPWNPHEGAPYRRPSNADITAFQEEVKRCGLPVYLRAPRGDDIDAACGQLALRGERAS